MKNGIQPYQAFIAMLDQLAHFTSQNKLEENRKHFIFMLSGIEKITEIKTYDAEKIVSACHKTVASLYRDDKKAQAYFKKQMTQWGQKIKKILNPA